MTSRVVTSIGVDPGPVPGFVILRCSSDGALRAQVVQCTVGLAPAVFETLLAVAHRADAGQAQVLVQVERFVVGRGSMVSARDGEITRNLIGALNEIVLGTDARIYQRSAAQVKPWATELRLASARLLEPTKGMRHARDAARHALFAAVHDGGVPDPLSKGARR